jgi:hypothetical protein
MNRLPFALKLQILENVRDFKTLEKILFNIKEFYDVFMENKLMIMPNLIYINYGANLALCYSVESNYLNGVKLYATTDVKIIKEILTFTVIHGYNEIAKIFLKNKFIDVENILDICAKHDNIEIMKFIVDKEPNYYCLDMVLDTAIWSGNIEIINYLISIGYYENLYLLHRAFQTSLNLEKMEIINHLIPYFINAGAKSLNYAAEICVKYEQMDLLKIIINAGANDLNGAFLRSAMYNMIEYMKYILSVGMCDLNDVLVCSIWFSIKVETVQYLVESGANDLNGALIKSFMNKKIDIDIAIAKYLVESGANDLNGSLKKFIQDFILDSDTLGLNGKECIDILLQNYRDSGRQDYPDVLEHLELLKNSY